MSQHMTNPQHPSQRAWRAPAAVVALAALVAIVIVLATAAFDRAMDSARLARPGAQAATAQAPVSIAPEVGTGVPAADRAFARRETPNEEPAPTF